MLNISNRFRRNTFFREKMLLVALEAKLTIPGATNGTFAHLLFKCLNSSTTIYYIHVYD